MATSPKESQECAGTHQKSMPICLATRLSPIPERKERSEGTSQQQWPRQREKATERVQQGVQQLLPRGEDRKEGEKR